MKSVKNIQFILSLTLVCGFIYFSGCTSAESTTGKISFFQKDYQKAEVELKKRFVLVNKMMPKDGIC